MLNLWDVLPEDALPVVTVIAMWSQSIRELPDGTREAAYDAQVDALYGEPGDEAAHARQGKRAAPAGRQPEPPAPTEPTQPTRPGQHGGARR